jgi:hypothetical protein
MTAKKDKIPLQELEGGDHEELWNLLAEESKILVRLDEIKESKGKIAEMLCAEANMTDQSKPKSIKFLVKGLEGVVVARRMDRTEITDEETKLKINTVVAQYEAKMKPIKDEMATAKKFLEVEALNNGKARKKPSYYANFDGKDKYDKTSEE